MNRYDPHSFQDAFERLGVAPGQTLLVHGSLMAFGRPENIAVSELPAVICEQLAAAVTPEGTIAVPTFTFDFCKGITFDRQRSPSRQMGAFSEHVRMRPDSVRTAHPMQSLALVGAYAAEVAARDTNSAFASNGPFQKLVDLDASILILGADFNSVSLIHLIEEKLSVPYRYWKSFTAGYVDQGIETTKTYQMYVRSLEENPLLRLYPVEDLLREAGLYSQETVGTGHISLFKARDFLRLAEEKMARNLRYFVSNSDRFMAS